MLRTLLGLICCFTIVIMTTKSALGAPTAEAAHAKQLYEQGLKKFDVGKFEDAAKDFEDAYQIVGQPTILYNIAQAYRQAKNHTKALLFYRTYLAAYTRKNAIAPNSAEVEQRIGEEQRLVDEAARVEKGEPRGPATPPEPPTTSPAEPADTKPTAPIPTPVDPAPLPAKPRSRTPLIVGAVLIGVGVIGLATGGALLGISAQRSNDIQTASTNGGEFTRDLQAKQNQGQTFEKAGIALAVVGGVAAIAGIVPLAVSASERRSKPVAVLPFFGPQVAGLQAEGRF